MPSGSWGGARTQVRAPLFFPTLEGIQDVTRPSILRLALPGVLLFLMAQGVLWITVWSGRLGEFLGPDSYMRMVRVLECRGGLDCPGGLLLRGNVPFGEVLHWPFLLDRLILILAWPFLPLLDFQDAVTLAGHMVGPLLGVCTILVLAAGARCVLEVGVARWVPLFAVTHFWVIFAFSPDRPDHHGLQLLLFVLALLGLFQILEREDQGPGSWVLGAALGLAVWVSTEGLASTVFFAGVLALVWIVGTRERLATALIRVWCVAAAILGLGILVDGPQPWRWAPDFDRFSVVHLTFFTLGGLFWALVKLKVPGTRAKRALAVLAGAVLGATLLMVLFPGIEGGPFSRIHPDLVPLWLEHVSEFVPAGQLGVSPWGLFSIVPGVLGLAIVGLGLGLGIGRLRGVVLRSRGVGWKWGVVALCVVWFVALSALGQVRWMQYLQILTPFPMAAILGLVIQRLNRMTAPSLLRAGGIVSAVTLFFMLPPFGLAFLGEHGEMNDRAEPCSPTSLISELGKVTGPGGRNARVLAPVFWGPELLFKTDVDVVAGPHHRNAQGMLDSHRIMAATSPEDALRGLREREIDFVAFCITESWIPLVPPDSSGTFYNALVEDRPPPWLRRIPLEGIGENYRLYQVLEEANTG